MSADLANHALRNRVDDERVALVYGSTLTVTLSTALMIAIIALAVWSKIPHSVLVGWALAVVAGRLLMEWLNYCYQRAPDRHTNPWRWGILYSVLIFPSAVIWGAAIFLLAPIDDPLIQTLIAVCLAMRGAAGLPTHASFPLAQYASAAPMMVALALRYATLGGAANYAMAAVWLLFMAYILIIGHRQAKNLITSLLLRYRNEQLVEELKRNNAEAEEARKRAEQASRSKSQFFAAANHDLRQPLHSLGLFATALKNSVTEPSKKELVDQILRCADSLVMLFDDLLDLSKLDAGQVRVRRERFSASQLLDRLETAFATPAKEKGLRLRIRLSPIALYSDQTLLFRVLSNLISNALRYTDRGGVLVACRKSGKHIHFEVWDTGIGIPADQHERIFEEFYQLHNPERDRAKGLGLGLATVRRITELLDHQLTMRSAPGKGSMFRLTLPFEHVLQGAKPSVTDEVVVPDLLRNKTIVVVDDEATVRQGMESLLLSWGCACVAAAEPEQVLDEINGRRPDFIIADLRLRNGRSGIDAIKELRARLGGAIPAIVISGDTATEQLQAVSAAGLTMLHKPLKAVRLRALLNHAFAQSA